MNCGHGKMRVFFSEQEGRKILWCVKCGAIQIQEFKRGAFGSISNGKFKTIRPSNHKVFASLPAGKDSDV